MLWLENYKSHIFDGFRFRRPKIRGINMKERTSRIQMMILPVYSSTLCRESKTAALHPWTVKASSKVDGFGLARSFYMDLN